MSPSAPPEGCDVDVVIFLILLELEALLVVAEIVDVELILPLTSKACVAPGGLSYHHLYRNQV